MTTNATIFLENLRYTWPGPNGFALDVAQFQLDAGESALLLGASGSGKSTLLSLICGTVAATSGTVCVCGQDLNALSPARRDRFRAEHIGVIFQQFNLLPFGSVADNILLPLRFAPKRQKRAGDAIATTAALCAALELPAGILSMQAGRLSVGQQQRVAVARALIGAPELLIADEPTSALDEGAQAAFLDLMFSQTRAQGTSVLMVSHDQRLASRFDRVLRIEDLLARTPA